jgi:hypothetical protein
MESTLTSIVILRKVGAIALTLLLGGTVLSEPLSAQTITIRILNGKSGRPLSNKNVTLYWSPDFAPLGTVVHLGNDGIGTVEVPVGSEILTMMGGPKVGKEPYRIPFINCNEPMTEKIQIAHVLKDGHVPANVCSKKSAVPRPGEIVFWAMPKPWWQLDMQ